MTGYLTLVSRYYDIFTYDNTVVMMCFQESLDFRDMY
jgi:hypothetical protein